MSTRVTFVPVDGIARTDPPTEDEQSRHALAQGFRYTLGVEGRDSTCIFCLEELKATDLTVTHAKCQNAYHDGCFGSHLASNADLIIIPVRSRCPLCTGILYPWPALVGPVFDLGSYLVGPLPPVFAAALGGNPDKPSRRVSPWGRGAHVIQRDLTLLDGPEAFGATRARRQAAIDRLIALGEGDADASHAICGRVEHGHRVLEFQATDARREIAERGKKCKHLQNIINSVRVLTINRNTVNAFNERVTRRLIKFLHGFVESWEESYDDDFIFDFIPDFVEFCDEVSNNDVRPPKEVCLHDFEDSSKDEDSNVDREYGGLFDRRSEARQQEYFLSAALNMINRILEDKDSLEDSLDSDDDEDPGDDEDSGDDEEHDDVTPMEH